MTNLNDMTPPTCPQCGTPIDRLRAPAVSVIDGQMTHFCSSECRERHLNRKQLEIKQEIPSSDTAFEPEAEADSSHPLPTELASSPHSVYRSKLLIHQLIPTIGYSIIIAVIIIMPPLFNGALQLALAGLVMASHLGLTLWKEHQNSWLRILESLAPIIASCGMIASAFLGQSRRTAAIGASVIVLIHTAGVLLEILGRHRSGVLAAVEGAPRLSLPSSWRDNSETASRIRTVSIALQWCRYPVAVAVGIAAFVISSGEILAALFGGITALTALSPRMLRMSTGDAHLGAALLASIRGMGIRDAFVVERIARSKVVLLIGKRSVLHRELSVVDWKVEDDIDERSVIDALHAVETNTHGRMAEAVSRYTRSRKARASSPVTVERHPGLGVESDTPWGRVLCGSRRFLLENDVSTALMDPHAAAIESSGRRAIFTAVDGRLAAVFGLEERFDDEVKAAMLRLQHMGIAPHLLTSANVQAGAALGERLGIETVYFDTSEEDMGEILKRLADSGARVILVGHGPAFEEHLQEARATIAVVGAEPTQAGVDARHASFSDIPWLIRVAKRSDESVVRNLISASAVILAGLGLGLSWFSFRVVLAVTVMATLAAAGSTWNAPYPLLDRLRKNLIAPLRMLARRVVRLRTQSR